MYLRVCCHKNWDRCSPISQRNERRAAVTSMFGDSSCWQRLKWQRIVGVVVSSCSASRASCTMLVLMLVQLFTVLVFQCQFLFQFNFLMPKFYFQCQTLKSSFWLHGIQLELVNSVFEHLFHVSVLYVCMILLLLRLLF